MTFLGRTACCLRTGRWRDVVEPQVIIVGGSLPSCPPARCASCHQWPESRAKSLPSREGCEPGQARENLALPGGLSRRGEGTQSRGRWPGGRRS